MFNNSLPSAVQLLSVPSSIELARKIQYEAVLTSLQTNPLSIAYTGQGEGDPPLVLLHGFDSSQLEFRFLCPKLIADRQTWTIDLPGLGFSFRPTEVSVNPLTIKTALYTFWKSAISRPMVLVGASMGGAVAMDFTLTYPDLVEKLVLIDSTGYTNAPSFVQFLVPPLDHLGVAYLRWRKLLAIQLSQLSGADASWLDLLHCATLHQEMPGWKKVCLNLTKVADITFYRIALQILINRL